MAIWGGLRRGAAWDEALRLDPNFSIERRRQILPFTADFERRLEGLRKAGAAA
jgi:adenylate cyclase